LCQAIICKIEPDRRLNPTTTGNWIKTPNLTTIPKPKTPFGNITAPTDEIPENNT
jgi:hypothetical protein